MKEKLSFYFKNWKTVPNLISFIRILLIPVFAVLFYNGQTIAAAVILALSGLSDLVDGKIARKYNQVSELGKILDPVADKLTVFAIAIILYLKFSKALNPTLNAFSWVFLLFIIKDFVMIFFAFIMILLGLRPCAAEIFGKVATTAFYVVMVIIMAIGPEVGAFRNFFCLPDSVMMVLVSIAAILTFVAFFSYLPDVFRQFGSLKKKKAGGEHND
ncbi:MAG: CDP-alcohol phosphatidyltransferase family protein [Clostridia bacterium]|nr:CDP-alcohol phosphatidyltransferase family protein [Clostridia bacterium]